MLRFWLTITALLAVVVPAPAAPPLKGQWIVVTAPAFRDAVAPLWEHRQADGLQVVVVATSDVLSPKEIQSGDGGKLREHIAKLCRAHQGPSYVLLVGAIEAGKLADAEKKVVPTVPGSAGRMKGQPSDNAYGCLDKELLPTVAVGRFPARTEDEARQMVRKTIDFEKNRAPAPWRRRLTILAGVPAFNPLVDRLVEGLALARLDRLDAAWHGRAIYHNPSSRFCVPDDKLQSQALKYVQDGQAFTLYLGHSSPSGLYAENARYLDREDWARLEIPHGTGVLFTFGCQGCQLKGGDGEGYGVSAMRNPRGPVAVVGSHGVCFAAMVQLGADGLFENAFTGQLPERVASPWLAVKQGLARGKIDDLTFRMLDAVDGDSKIPQATQRLEHLEMFVLLGDPALRLPVVPRDVELNLAEKAAPGATVTVKGRAPERLKDARVRLTLERPVGSTPVDLEPLPAPTPFKNSERDRVMLANHERANRFTLVTSEAMVRDGRFEATLTLPAKLPWPRLILRAYAANEKEEGIGVRVLDVQPMDPKKP
jgi:Peptidase family C25